MNKKFAVLGAAVVVAGAAAAFFYLKPGPEERAFRACETFIKARIPSPSAYRRLQAVVYTLDKREGYKTVLVSYEGGTILGIPHQLVQRCVFETETSGDFPSRNSMELGVSLSLLRGEPKSLEEPECCLIVP